MSEDQRHILDYIRSGKNIILDSCKYLHLLRLEHTPILL